MTGASQDLLSASLHQYMLTQNKAFTGGLTSGSVKDAESVRFCEGCGGDTIKHPWIHCVRCCVVGWDGIPDADCAGQVGPAAVSGHHRRWMAADGVCNVGAGPHSNVQE